MKYVWKNGEWRNPETGEPMETPKSNGVVMPTVWSDLPGYMSVVSNKFIEGRAARREDLKRTGCRPCEPEEGPKYCTSKKWAKRLGLEYNNDPGAGRPRHWDKDFTGKRIEATNG